MTNSTGYSELLGQ